MKEEQNEAKQVVKKLRYAEYYDIQPEFDALYQRSRNGEIFDNLMDLILSRENILLAYRSIKKNQGSKTPGTDKLNIDTLGSCDADELVEKVRYYTIGSQHGYRPKPVRRVDIPKPNGKTRPLGIPCIWDRLIQQSVKQVLEPICEAKFSKNSYGFRPDTSVEHALGSLYRKLQIEKVFYIVELDIKSFFDNVNHSKLIRQLWTMGIHDKTLLYLIKQMLKAPVRMPDGTTAHPDKGTPQGGIISPLLANIYLNEFDQWIDSQWQRFPIAEEHIVDNTNRGGGISRGKGYSIMRKTKLKEVYLIRYADDIRILARKESDAHSIKHACIDWLDKRLKLEISQEKTRIIDTRESFSEFLGFKIRVREKGNKYTVESHMSDKNIERVSKELKAQIKNIVHPRLPEKTVYDEIKLYNSMVLGIHEYYKYATDINIDCDKIQWPVMKALKNRTTYESVGRLKKSGRPLTDFEKKKFKNTKTLRYLACGEKNEPIYPIGYISTKFPMLKRTKVCRYTEEGRELVHKDLGLNTFLLRQLMEESSFGRSAEFMDNRLSLYCGQYGKCAVTDKLFSSTDEIECHHILPKELGGTDAYANLVFVLPEIHNLIHAKTADTIAKYLNMFDLDNKQIALINKYRLKANNNEIYCS